MEIDGSVSGDVVSGNKTVTQTAGGDIVGGDKLTHTGTGHIFAGSGNVTILQPALSPASAHDRANLLQLHHKVRAFWIEGVLERSVHSALLLELGRETHAEAVDHPWASVLELPDSTQRVLPQNISDVQVFDEANRALLILGQPGSGKTTTLLEIARDLLARAEADPAQAIPVVFNLSSWSAQRLPLKAWLVAELSNKYQVPGRLARSWVNQHRLLPLLDGLDEVDTHWQAACVTAINDSLSDPGLPGIVVCCRLDEYTSLSVRLRFNAAICVSPLSREQINAYLEAGGPGLTTLRSVLHSDDVLAGLAQTPLFLSLMCLAYRDLPAEALASPGSATPEHRRQQLLSQFAERMLKRKGQRPHYVTNAVLLRWLSWLARHASANNLTIFLPERLQPSWIEGASSQWAYAMVSRVGLWMILGFGLSLALFILAVTVEPSGASLSGYLAATFSGAASLRHLVTILAAIGRYTRVGLIAGLVCGAGFFLANQRVRTPRTPARPWWRAALLVFSTCAIPVSVVAFPQLLRAMLPLVGAPPLTVEGVFFHWVPVTLMAALALHSWRHSLNLTNDIPTIDTLEWSRLQSFRGGLAGFLIAIGLTSFCVWTVSTQMVWLDRLISLLLCGLMGGLLGGLVVGVLAGMRGRAFVEVPQDSHWLQRQARNMLTAVLVYGGVIGLTVGVLALASFYSVAVASGQAGTYWNVWVSGLGLGLSVGLESATVAALFYGGTGLIKRATLRLVLVAQQRFPWRFSRIAAQAEDLVFLRRVGGGYIFIHRLVQDYFASLAAK